MPTLTLIILLPLHTVWLLFETGLVINAAISLIPLYRLFPVTCTKHGDMTVVVEYLELPTFAAKSIRIFRHISSCQPLQLRYVTFLVFILVLNASLHL
jgi:hypothetical protein